MEINIPVPSGFDFKRTINSHGWSDLLPFEISTDGLALYRVLEIENSRPVTASVRSDGNRLIISVSQKLGRRAVTRVERDVRHIFRLDDDLTEFYHALSTDADFSWVERSGAGRLLRSPNVFEDLVKSLCTTNCSWSLTKVMTTALVNNLGEKTADGRRAFPKPEAMAAQTENFYREVVRAGYRAPYLKELADRVVAGELDVESWAKSELPTAELKREMKRVKGVGDYAAENLLKLVGRYDVLALDSWVRAKFIRTRNRGRACDDKKIARFYSKYGAWRGLALWCDMTRDWHE